MQTLSHQPYRRTEADFTRAMSAGDDATLSLNVEGGCVLEVCMGQFWSNSTIPLVVSAEISFFGIVPEPSHLVFRPGQRTSRVDICSPFRVDTAVPNATLRHLVQSVRPHTQTVRALSSTRDVLFIGRQSFEFLLEYKITVEEACDVIPTPGPGFTDLLYENPLEGQFWMLFDSHAALTHQGDAWPTSVKLNKGSYELKIQLRHDDVTLLEKLRNMPMMVQKTLSKEIKLSVFRDLAASVTGSGPVETLKLNVGSRVPLFFVAPTDDKIPSFAKPGDMLIGTLSFSQKLNPPKSGGVSAATAVANTFPVSFSVIAAPPKKEKDEKEESPEKEKDVDELVRDFHFKALTKLRGEESERRRETVAKLDSHVSGSSSASLFALSVLHEHLLHAEAKRATAGTGDVAASLRVISAADALINAIDGPAVAAALGLRADSTDKAAAKARKEAEKKRDYLTDALVKKASVLADLVGRHRNTPIAALSETTPSSPTTLAEALLPEPAASESTDRVADVSAAPAEPTTPSPAAVVAVALDFSASSSGSQTVEKLLEAVWSELGKWCDVKAESKHTLLVVAVDLANGKPGSALAHLNKMIGKVESGDALRRKMLESRAEISENLGWNHWTGLFRETILSKFPPTGHFPF
eukprot:TRINITY_DN3175_c0_g1_i2.p1 TRINITY_DN3175_c0_g1~~TRINITY_DN3175_c0_g1_i2.p1  ORF type:complete len:639 (-),score=196.09 TRINITY_DN3175_c0_g1_i2:30-1946(-)